MTQNASLEPAMTDMLRNALPDAAGACAMARANQDLLEQLARTTITTEEASRLRAEVVGLTARLDMLAAPPSPRKGYAMNPEERTVTYQDTGPLIYALIAGIVYGIIGFASGAASALAGFAATGNGVPVGAVMIAGLAGGLTAFATRALEGLRDQNRAETVKVGTPTPPAS